MRINKEPVHKLTSDLSQATAHKQQTMAPQAKGTKLCGQRKLFHSRLG